MNGATNPSPLLEGSLPVITMFFAIDRDKLLAVERAPVEKGRK